MAGIPYLATNRRLRRIRNDAAERENCTSVPDTRCFSMLDESNPRSNVTFHASCHENPLRKQTSQFVVRQCLANFESSGSFELPACVPDPASARVAVRSHRHSPALVVYAGVVSCLPFSARSTASNFAGLVALALADTAWSWFGVSRNIWPAW